MVTCIDLTMPLKRAKKGHSLLECRTFEIYPLFARGVGVAVEAEWSGVVGVLARPSLYGDVNYIKGLIGI